MRLVMFDANNFRQIHHPNMLLALGIGKNQTETESCKIIFDATDTFGFLHRVILQTGLELKSADVLNIGRDISSALVYLHSKELIHCSVASFSVTLTRRLNAKVNLENIYM